MATKTSAKKEASTIEHQIPVSHVGGGIYRDDEGNEYGPGDVEFNGSGWQTASNETLRNREARNEKIPQPAREPK
jgi:hypothetical protein